MYLLSSDEQQRFVSALKAAVAFPFIDSIEDYVLESIWGYAKDIPNVDPFFNIRSKRLFDVVDETNHIGWSVKSIQCQFSQGCPFELVIQRAAVIKKAKTLGFEELSLESDPNTIGAALLQHWKRKIEEDAQIQGIADKRVLILLKSKDKSRYAILEENIAEYSKEDLYWKWTSRGDTKGDGLQGIRKVDNFCVYKWYPSQTQFFERFILPENAFSFSIKPIRLSAKEVVDNMNTLLQERS